MNWLDFVLLADPAGLGRSRAFAKASRARSSGLPPRHLSRWCWGCGFTDSPGSFLIPYVSSPRVANLIGFLLVVFAVLVCGWSARLDRQPLPAHGRAFVFRPAARRGVRLRARAAHRDRAAHGLHGLRAARGFEDRVRASVVNSRFAPYVLDASHTFVAIGADGAQIKLPQCSTESGEGGTGNKTDNA